MSASAITDGIVTMLSAASVFGSTGVSKNSFQVMESTSGSCCIVQVPGLQSGATTFGTNYGNMRLWDFILYTYVRDTGDAPAAMNRMLTMIDTVVACIEADQSLQGTCFELRNISMRRDPQRAESYAGATWLPAEWHLGVVEQTT